MKHKILDTNVLVRLFMQDHKEQYNKAVKFFEDATNKEYKLFISIEVLLEFEYVLRSVYKISREEIAKDLNSLDQTKCVSFIDEKLVLKAILIYSVVNVDLVDITVFLRSEMLGLDLEFFDKDFKKIKRVYKQLS